MCGIAGILNLRGSLDKNGLEQLSIKMTDTMVHRGPDDAGVWVEPRGRCALAQRRLSIIEISSAGHQPMHSWDKRYTITFNGEIYNYAELRADLEKRGCKFLTRTDTEVLIEAVRIYGTNVFSKLDGMYAFAIYDNESGEILIARDPFGEKPLYYTEQNGYLGFASELHALTVLPGFDATIDADAVAQYFAFHYVPTPRSIYRKATKLAPGSFMVVFPTGETSIGRHFNFEPLVETGPQRSIDDLADELEDLLVRSIRRRLVADVPLGAFLSGGVDSSTVVALIAKSLGKKVKTFSIGFDSTGESEHLFARQMATHLGSEHHEKILDPDVLALSKKIGTVIDEPNSDSSCLPTYLLSQFARERVTVTLSGDGGDELFGGYGRYFTTLAEDQKRLNGDTALSGWTPGDAYFSDRILIFTEAALKRLLGTIPEATVELFKQLRSELNQSPLPLLSRMRSNDVRYYMPGAVLAKVDRMSMQHSLEVRCPFLSRDIAKFAEKLSPASCYSQGQGKLVLKQVAARYIPRSWLERSKMGFGLPAGTWGQKLFAAQLRKQVLSWESKSQYWIGKENIARFVETQENPATFSTYQTWAVLIFEQWLRTHSVKHETIPLGEPLYRKFIGRFLKDRGNTQYDSSYSEAR